MAKVIKFGDDVDKSITWMQVELGLESQPEVIERALLFYRYMVENRNRDNDSILVGKTPEQLFRLFLKNSK